MNVRALICGEESDAQALLRELQRGGGAVTCKIVATSAGFEAALAENWDIILSDYRIPGFSVLEALEIMRRRDCGTPVVVVAGPIGEEAAAECVRAGAYGFLARGDWARLGTVIDQARKFRDVTGLAVLQRNLRLSEEHFRTLIENATDLVAVIDDAGVIKYASPAGKRLLGYPREQVLGRNISTLIHPDDRESAQAQIASLGDVPVVVRYRLLHLNGTWRNFEFVGVRVKNESMQGIVINARDITDRVRAEEEISLLNATLEAKVRERTRELAEANAELSLRNRQVEASNRMKSVFLANMSHELRTPLNAIIGFTELLRDQFAGPLNDKQRDYLGHVYKASKHLLGLINEVLDLAKIEAGQIALNPETVDLPALLAEVRDLVAPMAREKNLRCETQCEPNLTLYADSARLRQILLNLVGNAVKFTPESGSVTIAARRQGKEVTISVVDSGVGIPLPEQEAVFEEFFRASLGAGVSAEGSGLGLPMVRRLVERLGGRVSLRSAPHQGSEFSVTIPVRAEEIEAAS